MKIDVEKLTGLNLDMPAVEVRHSELKRISDSPYKSECPACESGLLLMARDKMTYALSEIDYCILCGQQFKYLDIDELRRRWL